MSRAVIMAGWTDVPHIDAAEQARLLESTPPHLREARSKGIPAIGAGAIYPMALEDIQVDGFPIPKSWPVAYGMDVGWKATAAVWGAWDRDADIIYCWREYKRGQQEPAVHASAIQAAGKDLVGAIDPASRGRSQVDGKKLLSQYEDLGLKLELADNAVETGLFECWHRFSTGRLKLFKSLTQTATELRLYRRDEKGHVVKENDHLMDSLRYLVNSRDKIFNWIVPDSTDDKDEFGRRRKRGITAWT